MTDDITITVAKHAHLSQVEAWAVHDDPTKTLLKTPKAPVPATPSDQHWAALRGNEVVAIASVELTKERVGYVNCIVKPGHQRQGIGSRMIEYVLSQPSVKDLVHLHAAVDQSNIAAQKILNLNGFSRVGYSPDGRIEFARHILKE